MSLPISLNYLCYTNNLSMFQRINLWLSLVMISLSVWMYKSSVNPAIIHLLPLLAGIILLSLNNGIKEGSGEQKKVAGVLNFIVFVLSVAMFIIPNPYMEEDYGWYIAIMGFMSLLSFIYFLRERKK